MIQKPFLFVIGCMLSLKLLSGCAPIPEPERPKEAVIITPGKGIDEITLGKPASTVLKVMGTPENRTTFEEEQEAYTDFGYDTNIHLEFHLGFDTCFEYLQEQNRSRYPIYKIFFEQNNIHFITLSAYVYDREFLQQTSIFSEGLKFYSTTESMIQVLGTDYLHHSLAIYEIYDYLEKGITLLLENDKIVVVLIYAPLSPEVKQKYIEKILRLLNH